MTTPDVAVLAALARAEYRTSSRSSGNGACVMIGHANGWVGIQDSKQRPRATLPAAAAQFAALLAAARSGNLTP